MERRRYSVAEVRNRAQRRTSNLYDTYFTRVVSAWITALVAPVCVSPNTISFMNFFVGIGGCVLIGFGRSTPEVALGVVFVHVYAVLDSVDGELARLLDKGSLKGMFLEDWSAYGLMAAFPLAIALYLQGAGASPAAVFVAVLYACIGRNGMPALRRAIGQSQEIPRASSAASTDRQRRASGWRSRVEDHLLHQTNVRVVLTSLLLVHLAVPRSLPVLEIAFYLYMAAFYAREAGILFLVLRRDLMQSELRRLRDPDHTQP
jgi:phosphatidylglycerophosphate synthase